VKILILKPSSLGDVVQALPVLRSLKQRYPTSAIHWWIAEELASLLEGDPDLDGVFRFDRQAWRSFGGWRRMNASVRAMRELGFDWVLDLQGLARSGLFAWLANGAFTIGVDDPREGAAGFYDAAVPRPEVRTHAVDWYLTVLERLGVAAHLDFDWLPRRPGWRWTPPEGFMEGGPATRYVVLCPGARWLTKQWPAASFVQVIHLLADLDLRFVILGGAGDARTASEIARVDPRRCLSLAGCTTLPEMVECVRGCAAIVTNDTGPMHVAAALGRPVVAVFGPTDPARTGPYGQAEGVVRGRPPCAPCLQPVCANAEPLACLRQVTPIVVAQLVRQRLDCPIAVHRVNSPHAHRV
jgi:lipopolysaccharide heptosyltransferase I